MKEKMSSFDLMEITTMFEGFCSSVLDNPYPCDEALYLLPYLECVSGSKAEEIDPQVALEHVLKTQPKNELENLIQKKIKELVKNCSIEDDDGEEEKIDEEDIDVFNFDSKNKMAKKEGYSLSVSKHNHKKQGMNKMRKKGLLHRKRMIRKNNID